MSSIQAATSFTSLENLYPVVQDLTETEYGVEVCCGEMVGTFALADLALPSANARSLPPDEPDLKSGKRNSHHRGHTMFQTPSSFARRASVNHKRSNSDPTLETCPTDETAPSAISTEDARELGEVDAIAFDDVFVLTRQIHRGTLSCIWECVHREQGTRHCVKMIDKRRFTCRADKASALREIGMLTSLQMYQSSKFPRLAQVTEDAFQYYLVMDYVEGGSLADLRQARQHLTETHIHSIARSLLLSLSELHQLSVAHLNLNPENILLEPSLSDVVLCDFGNAWDLHNTNLSIITTALGRGTATIHDSSRSVCTASTASSTPHVGNLHYAAPELVSANKEFGLAADMWAVGVVLYELVCSRLPFEDSSKRSLKGKIGSGKFRFEGLAWHTISRGAKQFISALLHPDPQVRMTVGEALIHPWIAQPEFFGLGDDCSRDSSSLKSKKDVVRPASLVRRLWGKLRSRSTLQSPSSASHESSPIPTIPLKYSTHHEAPPIEMSKSTTSTISVFTTPTHDDSSTWESTLPRPLDHYRRPSLIGI